MPRDDERLLRKWRFEGDRLALDTLIARYGGLALGTCRRILKNEEQARDAAQECLITFFEKCPADVNSISGWLHTVATNHALKLSRSESRRRTREQTYAETAMQQPDEATEELTRDELDEAIEHLPEPVRYALIEHYFEQRTHREIAKHEGVARQTVTSRIDKGLQLLREEFVSRGVAVPLPLLAKVLEQEMPKNAPSWFVTVAIERVAGEASAMAAGAIQNIVGGAGFKAAAAIAVVVLAGVWWIGPNFVKANGDSLETTHPESTTAEPNTQPTQVAALQEEDSSHEDASTTAATSTAAETGSTLYTNASVPGYPPELLPDGVGEIGAVADYVTIQGIVTNTEGSPIGGARVFLAPTGQVGTEVDRAQFAASRDMSLHRKVIADSEGRFVIPRITLAGSARIAATADGYPASSERIGIVAGQDMDGLNLILDSGGMVIEGYLRLPNGDPAIGAHVITPTYYSDRFFTTTTVRNFTYTDDKGYFALNTFHDSEEKKGTYGNAVVLVQAASGERAVFQDVPFGRGKAPELDIPEPARIHGQIQVPDGHEGGPYYVAVSEFLTANLLDENGEKRGQNRTDYGLASVYGAWTDENFRYAIENVPADREFTRNVFAVDGSDVVPRQDFEPFRPGEARTHNIDIADGFLVTGTVVNAHTEEPMRFMRHAYYHPESQMLENEMGWTDEDGRFAFRIDPAKKGVRVFPNYRFARRPTWQTIIENHGVDVLLSGGGQEEVTLELPPPVTLNVVIRDEDGMPIPGVSLWVGNTPNSFTDVDGRFSWTRPPYGQAWLTIRKRGWLEQDIRPTLDGKAGQTITEERTMVAAAGGLEGILIGPDGETFSGMVNARASIENAYSPEKEGVFVRPNGYFVIRDWPAAGRLKAITFEYVNEVRYVDQDESQGNTSTGIARLSSTHVKGEVRPEGLELSPDTITNIGTVQLNRVE